MSRCMDPATFPTGACPYYANAYYKGGADYKGVYTSKQKPGTIFPAIKVNGNTITISMAKPFPDMPYWGIVPGQRPGPAGPEGLGPADLQEEARGRPVRT